MKNLMTEIKRRCECNKKQDVFMESITKDGMTETHIYWESDGKPHGYTFNFVNELNEAEYQGRKVKLGKVMQGDTKKFKVYVKNPKGNVVKVNFGQGGDAKGGTMRIRKSNPTQPVNHLGLDITVTILDQDTRLVIGVARSGRWQYNY